MCSRSGVPDSSTPWTAARQASPSITNSRSLLKLMSIDLVMASSHLILCRPLLLLEPHGAPPLHSSLFSNTLPCKPKSLCIEENNRIRKTRDGMLEGNKCYERNNRSTPGGPVKIPCFQYRGSGFNPQSGNWDHTCLLVWSKEGENGIKWALSK